MIALRLRDQKAKGPFLAIRHLPYVAKPLLARCLRRSQTLALSVVSRGFFSDKAARRRQQWEGRERWFCLAFLLVTLAVLFSKVSFLLSEQGLYAGSLRGFYDFSSLYL